MIRNASFIKLTQWEHWPTLVYYIPLLPFFLWRSIKAGHPIYYTVANPAILFSGNGTESKFKTLELLPNSLIPKGFLFKQNDKLPELDSLIIQHGFDFPLIAKPDIGFRGYLVKKIDSLPELENYVQQVKENIIIQEFIPYENELGIFYHRIPDQTKGSVTSVTIKKFIKIKGNGILNISQLIENDERAFLYRDLFRKIHQDKLEYVLSDGQEMTLSVIGNHSKGTQFINGNHLINRELEEFIDTICHQIKGWYYGRLDIKYDTYEKLVKGKDFKILEINGIISEPTHIYDATHKNASFIGALKTINSHWEIMGGIAKKIHQDQQVPYPPVMAYIKNMLWLRSHTRKLKKLNAKDF